MFFAPSLRAISMCLVDFWFESISDYSGKKKQVEIDWLIVQGGLIEYRLLPQLSKSNCVTRSRESLLGCFRSRTNVDESCEAFNACEQCRKFETTGSFKQPRQRRQEEPHKFAYLTMENSIFARFARAYFIFWHFEDVLVLSTTWNDLFCSCVDDESIWWQMFNFVLLCPKRWFQFNSRIVRTHFSSIMTVNNWKMIAETRSFFYLFIYLASPGFLAGMPQQHEPITVVP